MPYFNGGFHYWLGKPPKPCTVRLCDPCAPANVPGWNAAARHGAEHHATGFRWAPYYGGETRCSACGGPIDLPAPVYIYKRHGVATDLSRNVYSLHAHDGQQVSGAFIATGPEAIGYAARQGLHAISYAQLRMLEAAAAEAIDELFAREF